MAQPLRIGVCIIRRHRHQHLGWDAQWRLVAVHLFKNAINNATWRKVFHLVHDEPFAADNSSFTNEKDLNSGFQFIVSNSDDVEIFIPLAHHLLLFNCPLNAAKAVTQPSSLFEFLRCRCLLHLTHETIHDRISIAIQERNQLGHMIRINLWLHLADTRPAAFLNMEQKTRTLKTLMLVELSLTARANRESPQQQVKGLTDSPRMWIRTKISSALALCSAHHYCPRVFLVNCHREKRITLVITKPHVKTRMMLLDEGVLKNECFHFISYFNPFHGVSRLHHCSGTGM